MKTGFYTKLAITGMSKNRKLYTPYLLTCIMMVTIFYLMSYLSVTDALNKMKGAEDLSMILGLGMWIIGVFSFVFLFYTNSFLVRRRMKEYGLYNMLGMGKRNISKLIISETLISYITTTGIGIAVGILLSRLAEMLMYNIVGGIVEYSFMIPKESIMSTLLAFGIIYAAIFLNSLRIVRKSKAVEMLRSETVGEKPPKSNWLLAIMGVVILGGAYYLAVAIKQPMEALFYFVIAVILVIIGTYLLFVAGSVVLCKKLMQNKSYYYKKEHFVSTSQMAYRMKRNGAGLASICILLTMVLVTMSITTCLYLGSEECMHSRYPKEINARWMDYGYEYGGDKLKDTFKAEVEATVEKSGVTTKNARWYDEYAITGYLENSNVQMTLNSKTDFAFIDYDKVCEVHFIDIEDYNRTFNQNIKLNKGEAVAQTIRTNDLSDSFTCGELTFKVKERLPDHTIDLFGSSDASVCSTIFLFIPNMYETVKGLDQYKDYNGDDMLCHCWYYEFDPSVEQSDTVLQGLINSIFDKLDDYNHWNLSVDSQQLKRSDFYGTFGGLLFIGGLLSLVFLAAAILIIYYKQVSEGYEDQKRFQIMQKVGMTKEDIKKSINSQIKLLFVLPIATAGLHLAFAFPFMNRLLMLFGLLNVKLLITITATCLLIFSIVYVIAYKLTSNSYYKLVALLQD